MAHLFFGLLSFNIFLMFSFILFFKLSFNFMGCMIKLNVYYLMI